MRQIIRTWARFKSLITATSSTHTLYQLEDCDGFYFLSLVGAIDFTFDLEKGGADATDYENNYKSSAIICNCSTD